MRHGWRLPAGAVVLLAVTSCATIPRATAPAPQPPVTKDRDTEAPERREFAFEGALSQGGLAIGTAPSGTIALTLDGGAVPVTPNGRFLIAFDRNAGPSATLVATLANGRTLSHVITVASRAWDIERVDIARTASTPSEAFERLRAPEVARINAARRIDSAIDGWSQRFIWPARGRLSGVFGSQRIYRGVPGDYHSGVDIAPGGAGGSIVSPADGVVVLATEQPFTLEGNLVIVDHGMGLNSAFLHLSRIDVREGQRLKRGDPIGLIGATGRATGPHLHWALKWRAARIDPQLIVGPMPN